MLCYCEVSEGGDQKERHGLLKSCHLLDLNTAIGGMHVIQPWLVPLSTTHVPLFDRP